LKNVQDLRTQLNQAAVRGDWNTFEKIEQTLSTMNDPISSNLSADMRIALAGYQDARRNYVRDYVLYMMNEKRYRKTIEEFKKLERDDDILNPAPPRKIPHKKKLDAAA
jgi:hypothetical protein